jgi:RNA polymerase sigma-70 factor (ECF subfamily)
MQPDTTVRTPAAPAAGQADRFAALYRAHVLPLYRYFHQCVGNPEDAEDLTATTFARALASLGRYDERGSFAAWLFAIARHTLRDHRRRRRPRADLDALGPVLADPGPSVEARVLRAEQARLLVALVRALPDDQREALVLRVFARLSTAEVAAVLGRSEGAVKMLVHRAVARLRRQYRAEEGT